MTTASGRLWLVTMTSPSLASFTYRLAFQSDWHTMGLLPQLVDRLVRSVLRERHVLESAIERVVVAHGGVVDAQRRVDRADDVLGADVAIGAPAVLGHAGA